MIQASKKFGGKNLNFEYVQVIWHNWAIMGPHIGVAAPQAPVGVWVRSPLKSLVTGPCLLVNCFLGNKFHKKIRGNPPQLKSYEPKTICPYLDIRTTFDRFWPINWSNINILNGTNMI